MIGLLDVLPALRKRSIVHVFVVACLLLLAFVLSAALPFAQRAHAAAGTVYSCSVHPSYQHPVTGEIEDAGGTSSRATGQAMVESCVASAGMLEVTEAGDCFLTIRMSLVDLTSGHTFAVQDWGASGWSTPAMGVTATGRDSNGTTNDLCIQLPSNAGIVRISMLVESMGREVVFYVYASDFAEGAPSGFNATIVTEPLGAEAEPVATDAPAEQAPAPQPDQEAAASAEQVQVEGSGQEGAPSEGTGTQAAPASAATSGAGSAATAAGGQASTPSTPSAASSSSSASGTSGISGISGISGTAGASGTSGTASNSASAVDASGNVATAAASAVQGADDLVEGAGATTAQGLSLSTAPQVARTATAEGSEGTAGPPPLVALWFGVVGGGVVLMLCAACIVYVFRRNWNRWGGVDPDDYSEEYRHGRSGEA